MAGLDQNLRNGESRSASVVVDVRFARGHRTAGGARGTVAGSRRGSADVRAAGLRRAAGRGRRAAAVGARSVAEKLGIHSVHASYCPIFLPSPHHRPHPLAPETRARARAVAGTIRTDGAMVAARLLVDAVSRERPP